MKLYVGLLALGIILMVGGIWFFLNPIYRPVVEIPEGEPIIAMELDFVMRGVFEKLYLYDDGVVLYVEEKNLRMPTPECPPTRTWNTGIISKEDLNGLIQLFQTGEFAELDKYYQFSGKPMEPIEGVPTGGFTMGDGSFTFSINYGDIQKTVTALGYLTPDHGLTYPDMPYPLDEIYQKLKQVIDNTKEVYSEPIQSSTDEESDNEPETVANISANRVHIEKGEYILFSGHSQLPEGTYLQTQLYADDEPEEWWPGERYIEVENGSWQITVRLGENGVPDALLVGPGYFFKVWEKDDPSVWGGIPFDLVGPPARGSENETENDNSATSVQEPVEIVSVVGPLEPINPGGPVVEITLKNVAAEAVISLTASLELGRAFDFTFDVTDAYPLLPGRTRSVRKTLITGGFSDSVSYPITITVKLRDGEEFVYTKLVLIEPPPGK